MPAIGGPGLCSKEHVGTVEDVLLSSPTVGSGFDCRRLGSSFHLYNESGVADIGRARSQTVAWAGTSVP
jgi:hypothetical protein